jgi:ferredoxin-like protein FixX
MAQDDAQSSIETLSIEDKLGRNVFKIDKESPHIVIDHNTCRQQCTLRPTTSAMRCSWTTKVAWSVELA